MSGVSAGRGPAHGGNENHDGDATHTTLGEAASNDQPPAGADVLDQAAPPVPAGVPGAPAEPGIASGPASYPDGPNIEADPQALDAARGQVGPGPLKSGG